MFFLIKTAIFPLFLILLIALSSSGQQIDRNQRNPKEAYFDLESGKNDYIKEWLIIGPFPRAKHSENASPLHVYGGEANIRPYEGMKIAAPDGKTHTWKRHKSKSDTINLQEAIGESEDAIIEGVFYVACNLLSPKDQRLEMIINTDLQVKIWLNSQLVHSRPIATTAPWKEDRLGIFLNKGANPCLIKVGQYVAGAEGRWGFNIQVLDYEAYLRSLQLKLSVQRQKPGGKDHLVISARREPKSVVWQLPSFPFPVNIEITDEIGDMGNYVGAKHSQNASPNASPPRILQTREGQPVGWTVPEAVDGSISIIARQTDNLGIRREARFTCKAHNIVAVTPKVGHWETYSVARGLGGSIVMSTVQDRNGFLWFGLLAEGICRYDGRTFKTFTKEDGLPSNNVWMIFEDGAGNLWFGTMEYWTGKGAGVCKYDGKTFKTFTTKDGLVSDAVIAIYEDNRGHLWFGTTKGVSEFDGKTFRNYTVENGLLSDQVGTITQDKNGNFWFGYGLKTSSGRAVGATRYNGKSFKHFTTKDGLISNAVVSIITDKRGNLWFGTRGGVSKYDGKSFQNFTEAEGLADSLVEDLFQTRNGDLWVATEGGVSRYRDGRFQNFTAKDGLAHNWVECITEDREGNLWFGTWGGGVSRYDESFESSPVDIRGGIRDTKGNLWSHIPGVGLGRYDGKNLQTFAIEDGLLDTDIRGGGIREDRRGNIWVGTVSGGLARYDGEKFQTFTTKDGLPSNSVWAIYEDEKGVLWIGTQGGGVCTYDGVKFVQVAGRKELGGKWTWVSRIIEDRSGNIWVATRNAGVSRYDGVKFTRFTTENGLPHNTSSSLLEDRKGNIWIATVGGVCRYDEKTFRVYTTKDGLAENRVDHVFEDSQGNLWFGVATGGVHKFDGKNFQNFTTDDGLLSNSVDWGVTEDEKGNMIFATSSGITIYTPPKEKIPPPIHVTEVVADKVYPIPVETRDLASLRISSTTPRLSFAYYGTSFKTKRMKYNYMLEGYDKDWKATWDETVSYEKLKPGKYSFKVIAINRDLVYSEKPATVQLAIVTPFYLSAAFLVPTLGIGTILLVTSVIFSTAFVKHRRQILAYQKLAVQELQDARQMQMSLLPQKPPTLESIKIAGKCISANTVGGDFFDYLPSRSRNEVGIVIGDVTGKGLKGAMYAVMTDGILHNSAKLREKLSPEVLLTELNESLKDRIERDMNVTMVIGLVNAESKTLTIANAGHHIYPIILHNGELEFLRAKGLPLGMKTGIKYGERQFQLGSGDVVIFMTDGIIEARDKEDKLYLESGRLEQTISQFGGNISAEAMVEAIIADAMDFGGSKDSRDDDMTVVVAKVL